MTTNLVTYKAFGIALALNSGAAARDALRAVRISPLGVTGTDIGDECLSIDDPHNDTIDLGWHDFTHVQVRRLSEHGKWMVEVMQRFNDNGTPHD